jgi:hypothetical protein
MRSIPILGAAIAMTLGGPAAAQSEIQKLLASDGLTQDIFGKSVAVAGERALVGQTGLSSGDGGSVYAFRRDPSGWVQVQHLSGSDNAPSDWFGFAAAMSGTTAAVGAMSHDHGGVGGSGAVYVLEHDRGAWHEAQELLPPVPEAGDGFGYAVAIDGDVLVTSATGHDTRGMHNAGIVHVFERRPHGWIHTAALVPADLAADDTFGSDVAVSGTTILVGKSRDNGYRGAAYVFEKTPGGWEETAKLTASDGAAFDHFGWSLAVDGGRVLVGAVGGGSAYVFDRTPAGWLERAQLSSADVAPPWDFGYEVSLEGDTAFVGKPGVNGGSQVPGAVYVFRRNGLAWPFVARLSPADPSPRDAFGAFLASDGETLLAGASWDDDLGYLSGSAYFFSVPEFATPYGFCPGSGICGNADPVAGCANSKASGARLAARGSGSIARDDFALAADSMPAGRTVVFFRGGAATQNPYGDGLRQVAAGSLGLRRFEPTSTAADGTAALGPGVLGSSGILPGQTWFFQAWYTDPSGPCGSGFNGTNAVRAVFGP